MKKLLLLVGLVVFLTPSFTYGLDNEFNIDSLIDDLKIEVKKERKEKEKQNLLKKKQIEEKKTPRMVNAIKLVAADNKNNCLLDLIFENVDLTRLKEKKFIFSGLK